MECIGEQCFSGTAITELTVPLSVIQIGEEAFPKGANIIHIKIVYGDWENGA